MRIYFLLTAILTAVVAPLRGVAQDEIAVRLPNGVKAVWDLDKADREQTPTRERLCLNGLWRWQPMRGRDAAVPQAEWGYFKVPGCWPGITDYMQKDCQTVFTHPSWKDERLSGVAAAFYQREVTVPKEWAGRRISLSVEYLNSHAMVHIDGAKAGELRFPGGELDLTAHCKPGQKHVVTMLVTALPLKSVLLSFGDTNTPKAVAGSVARRGLCGDVFLIGTPDGPRVSNVKVSASVRKGEITFDARVDRAAADATYTLHARVTDDDGKGAPREFTSRPFRGEVADGRMAFTAAWKPDELWDIRQVDPRRPRGMYRLTLTLRDAQGKTLDTAFGARFGFRELRIDGKDFYLNGTRIHLCAVPLDNAEVSAALASYEGAKESLRRLQSIGINFVYTHNYGCEPGTHLSFSEVLRAADDVGMLVALSQPHYGQYDWKEADADKSNGYARHAEYYVRQAQNHPSVIAYAMSHNATGYDEDMNPDLIDGLKEPRTAGYELSNAARAMRAEAIVSRLDDSRIVYHHSSGNLGSMHTINFYPNFVPIQEMSDWFGHWSAKGVKPVFTCEYGAPFSWDWAMYRGWFKGERSWGSAKVPWDWCLSEWNAQFLGDAAFRTSEPEKANLRWEAKQFRTSAGWHRWDYPNDLNSKRFDERYPVMAMYLNDNWRAFRTWGVSAISPWEHGQYWKLREGVNRGRKELSVDWDRLQRPGFSADYIDQRYERMDLAYERDDWAPTVAADALLRNNQPTLAYIAGKAEAFTSKDHLFLPGETFQKQVIVINNSRAPIECACSWSLALPTPIKGNKMIAVQPGDQGRLPLTFNVPENLVPGEYKLSAKFVFDGRETQDDSFVVHLLPVPAAGAKVMIGAKIALFDPHGEMKPTLRNMGVDYQSIDADADLAGFDVLIVGKAALTPGGAAPDISRVRAGLRVLIFEQTGDALEKRFGFRVAEYGLRQVFRRIPDHPLAAGLTEEHLRDWRGDATILPPSLSYELRPRYGPTVRWCGISVPRLWRCGNRGNVASVLIEKPPRGDFLPIFDGGYSLQYSPLLEYREGRGMVLFCQMDVSARTESEPVAQMLTRRLLEYVSNWKPSPRRTAVYVGDAAGKKHLEACGLDVLAYEPGKLTADHVLVIGAGGGRQIAGDADAIAAWLGKGGHLLAVGIDERDTAALPSLKIKLVKGEHIASYFPAPGAASPFAGLGPADVHNRDPKDLFLVADGAAKPLGDGIIAATDDGIVVICQMTPWQFGGSQQQNLRKTLRRSSFLLSRLLANLGVAAGTPIIDRFHAPVSPTKKEERWGLGLYLDAPQEWDDPYRFFRW